MSKELTKIEYTANVSTSVEFVPTTLYFSLGTVFGKHISLSGDLKLGGVKIGGSDYRDFLQEEIAQLEEIVRAATLRHVNKLRDYGNA